MSEERGLAEAEALAASLPGEPTTRSLRAPPSSSSSPGPPMSVSSPPPPETLSSPSPRRPGAIRRVPAPSTLEVVKMPPMRILIWHGYLLGGTGSNVYTRALAREWSRAGHDVTVFSQERHPEQFDLAGAELVRPDIGGLLPVFVLDRYEGLDARLLQDLTREERERCVELNAAAIRERLPADVVFANHVLLGGPVGAATGARFAVKAHGSELEYSMRGNADLSSWGRESLERAEAVFVGSAH